MGNHVSMATLVFAKEPGKGTAKSRIAATHGRETADRIYVELLDTTASELGDIDFHVAYTDSRQPMSLKQAFADATSFFAQKGSDLGERLQNAFEHLFEAGYQAVCAVGVDCPDLSVDDIIEAQNRLENGADVVLGPAEDGGYYLVACKPHALDIFDVDSWGTERLFAETLAVIEREKFSVELLDKHRDIDSYDDYVAWKTACDL